MSLSKLFNDRNSGSHRGPCQPSQGLRGLGRSTWRTKIPGAVQGRVRSALRPTRRGRGWNEPEEDSEALHEHHLSHVKKASKRSQEGRRLGGSRAKPAASASAGDARCETGGCRPRIGQFCSALSRSRASCAPVRATVGRFTAVSSGRQSATEIDPKRLNCSNNGLNRRMPPTRIELVHAV